MAKAEDTCAEIWVSKLSDCQLLTRDHVQCTQIDELTVRLDAPLMHGINGAFQHDSNDEWQETVRHLLLTYKPAGMSISFGDFTPEIQSIFTVSMPIGRSKAGLLSVKHQLLSKFTLDNITQYSEGDLHLLRDDNYIHDIMRLGYVIALSDDILSIYR